MSRWALPKPLGFALVLIGVRMVGLCAPYRDSTVMLFFLAWRILNVL